MMARTLCSTARFAPTSLAVGLALALAAAAAGAATPGVDEPPLAGPAAELVLPPIVVRTLDNGLTVIVARRSATPLVTVAVRLRAGAERDEPGHAGVADLTATLLPRGTLRHGRPLATLAIARQAETLGGDLSAGSSFGSSEVALTVTTPHVGDALGLLADLVRHPTFPDAEFKRTVAEKQDELRLAMSSPGRVAGQAARRAFWGDSPYGASVTPASLARATRADLQRFHAQTYRPDIAAVIFAGDIDETAALALARQAFGDWKAPASALPAVSMTPPASRAPALLSIDLGGVGQSGVVVAAPFVPLGAPERYVAQVTNAVLGGGYSARLNEEVRIKRGLAYGAGSRGDSQAAGGVVLAQAQTNNPTAGQVVGLVRDELANLGRTAPPAEELAARQATLVGGFGRQLDTTSSFAELVGNQWTRGLPMADLARYTERVLAVTPEQVRDFAATHWTPQSLRVVVAGDQSKSGEGLKKLAPDGVFVKLSDVDFEKATLLK
jgi:zinc protease